MRATLTTSQLDALVSMTDTEPDDWRISYSGRGMFGRGCLGYDGDRPTRMVEFELAVLLTGEDNPDLDDVRDALDNLESSVDSMGLGRIVYWPQVTVGAES